MHARGLQPLPAALERELRRDAKETKHTVAPTISASQHDAAGHARRRSLFRRLETPKPVSLAAAFRVVPFAVSSPFLQPVGGENTPAGGGVGTPDDADAAAVALEDADPTEQGANVLLLFDALLRRSAPALSIVVVRQFLAIADPLALIQRWLREMAATRLPVRLCEKLHLKLLARL